MITGVQPFVGSREKRKRGKHAKTVLVRLILPVTTGQPQMDTSPPSIPNDFRWSQSTVFTLSEPFLANTILFCILRSLGSKSESCTYFRSEIICNGKFGRLPSKSPTLLSRLPDLRKSQIRICKTAYRSALGPFRSYEKFEERSWHFTKYFNCDFTYVISINELLNYQSVSYILICISIFDFQELILLFIWMKNVCFYMLDLTFYILLYV